MITNNRIVSMVTESLASNISCEYDTYPHLPFSEAEFNERPDGQMGRQHPEFIFAEQQENSVALKHEANRDCDNLKICFCG